MKHASRLLSLLVLTVAFAVLAGSACDQGAAPERAWERGSFMPVPENTKPYSLPAGIEIVASIGADTVLPASLLPLLTTFRNSNSGNVQVTLPAGLLFESPDPEYDYQYMILLQDYTFTAEPGDSTELLPTYCCNEDFDLPDEESNYSEADREWDKETQELIDLVAGKSIDSEDKADMVQEALFEITDGEGLQDSTRTKLQGL